ncbi:hypothetical protein O3G_MSEX008323 [Manduca sexta]|uniref:Cyclin-like domain-containing protein n=1 Tax=Manduca sexta TaxID=7130 RepID=A0A921Z9E3_MANSE|nr:hypothetical protein O3G_MSEX008323 [Manduca sexta]
MYYYLNGVEWEKPACGPHGTAPRPRALPATAPPAPIICSASGAHTGRSLRLGHSPSSQRTALSQQRSFRSISCSVVRATRAERERPINRCAVSAAAGDMELLCAERVSLSSSGSGEGARAAPAPCAAGPDPVLLRRRVLDNLLRTEERYAVTANYFSTVQTEVAPHMRRVVAEWMLEICEDQGCQEEVFPLAISYLDRFLSTCNVSKSQVQLLATACLLLASKLREPGSRALPADLLVFYTANSITLNDLCSWELLVLSKLKWDVAGVTAHDFLPLLLSRLPLRGHVNTEMVHRHAQTFIALAARGKKSIYFIYTYIM